MDRRIGPVTVNLELMQADQRGLADISVLSRAKIGRRRMTNTKSSLTVFHFEHAGLSPDAGQAGKVGVQCIEMWS